MKTHKDLDIWKRGIEFVEQIYKVTNTFPKEELYGLTSQMRRSAVSYPSNIAEGAARSSKKEFIHFLYVALASLSEVETQLIIGERLRYLRAGTLLEGVEALRRMTLNFIKYLKLRKANE
jgi:four helix bundle protein